MELAMPTLDIWCIDKASVVTKLVETCDEIRALMFPCLKHQSHFDDIGVYFPQYKCSPTNTDLVIYYLNTPDSVAFVLDGNADSTLGEDSGQTIWSTAEGGVWKHCSELRVGAGTKANPRALANLTFHEFLHNKLKIGDTMHSRGGLAGASVDENTQLTTQNAKDMGQALSKQRVQWMGGYDSL
jgi:hypothetical protein